MKFPLQVHVLFCTIFLVGWTEMAIIGLIEQISAEFNTEAAHVGEIIAAYSISFALGAPLLIYITRNMSRRRLIIGLSVAFLATNFLSSISPNSLTLSLSRIILASISGALAGTILGSVINLVDKKEVGNALSYILVGFGASLILGVPLSVSIADELGWRLTFSIVSVLSILVIIVQVKVLPKAIDKTNYHFSPSEYLSRVVSLPVDSYVGLILTLLWMTGYSILFTYFPVLLSSNYGHESGEISVLLAIFGISTLIGSKFGGLFNDRIGSKATISISLTIHGLILFFAGHLLDNLYSAIVFSILWGISSWMSTPAIQALIALNSRGVEDIMLTLNNSLLHIGIAIGALIGGMFISQNADNIYLFSASTILLSLGMLVVLLFKQEKGAKWQRQI